MGDDVGFAAPAWGTWEQNRAHNPQPVTRLLQELYPPSFGRGFAESIEAMGAPLVSVTMGHIQGFDYLRFQFLGEPGADGPVDPETIGAMVGKRAAAAQRAFEDKTWLDSLALWDTELKPASIARHRELGGVELASLDDDALAEHLDACVAHYEAMVYQHHRFNIACLLPVGDFVVNTAAWTGRSPAQLLGLFEGCSPISGVWSDEIAPAATAIAEDDEALAMLGESDDPAATLAQLRARVPAVDDFVRSVDFRLVDGFDFLSPTLKESPALILGKLAAAVDAGSPGDQDGVERLVADVRAAVPDPQRTMFDEMLADAQCVYRLRDERGIYSDTAAAGLVRLALLELGHRLVARGVLDDPCLVLDASLTEIAKLARGATAPSGADLRLRVDARLAAGSLDAPPILGPPHGPPPPPGALPPALERVAAALGFLIPAMLAEVDEPSLTGNVIRGLPGNAGSFRGRARVIRDHSDLATLEPGDVMVARVTAEAFNAAIHVVGAIVTDHGGIASHAAILAREVGIPCVVGTAVATTRVPEGATIVVDGTSGEVTILDASEEVTSGARR